MKYYRVEDVRTTGGPQVYLREFDVVKTTEKGVWIESYGWRRFVLTGAHRRYACATIDDAIESFKARKARQRKILTAQLTHVERALARLDDDMAYWRKAQESNPPPALAGP